MNPNENEVLPLEEVTHKTFYIGVNYYDGKIPYTIGCYENPPSNSEVIYKINIPYKD